MSDRFTEITDVKSHWYSAVDDKVIFDAQLSMTARVVYAALCTFATIKRRSCWPKISTLAEGIGVSIRTVQRALRELECRGVVMRRENFNNGQQITTTYFLTGWNAFCYLEDEVETPPESPLPPKGYYEAEASNATPLCDKIDATPLTDMSPQEVYKNNNIFIPKGGESPVSESIESQNPKEKISQPEDRFNIKDAPYKMRATAEYFLFKTGRDYLTEGDISALREFDAHQVPARVQSEIDKVLKRFAQQGKDIHTLSLQYIAKILRNQPTFSRDTGTKKKSKADIEAVKEANRELTPDKTPKYSEEEADKIDAWLEEIVSGMKSSQRGAAI